MDTIIKNVLIYTENGNIHGDIFIKGNTIAAVGDIPDDLVADKVIDGSSKLAIPGLINCHTHSYMSLFRNIADDLTFGDWLFGAIMPKEDRLTYEDAEAGAMLSCMEMIKSGTTCFMDMHMFPMISAEAAHTLGMRAVMTRGLTGADRNDEGGQRRYNEHMAERERYADDPRISFRLAPHAIYTCGDDYLRFLIEKAHETGQGFHIHLSESRTEIENCMKEHGCSPVEYLDSIGFFDIPTCAAHCVHLTDRDIEILRDRHVNVIHNPRSNLKLANGIAPVAKLMKSGVNVCLGTDSQASNNDLNMFTEMGFAALLQKGVTEDPVVCSAQETVRMATANGAAALGINSGVIACGKLADIVLLDLSQTAYCPKNDLRSALVYSSGGMKADTVIIDGETVLEHGVLTNADEEKIYHDAQRAADKF